VSEPRRYRSGDPRLVARYDTADHAGARSRRRGRYWRSMESGPRAITKNNIDRAKAANTRGFPKARSMRAVLRATTTAKEDL
jgi:hypothetical protein